MFTPNEILVLIFLWICFTVATYKKMICSITGETPLNNTVSIIIEIIKSVFDR